VPAADTRAVLFVGGVLLKISSIKKLSDFFFLRLTLSISECHGQSFLRPHGWFYKWFHLMQPLDEREGCD
jgi:hypothetical protein